MLREAWLTRQACAAHTAAHAGGQQLVVEAVTQVEHFRLLVIRPPAELVALTADFTQGVDVTHVADYLVHPGALGRQEAGWLLAVAPVLHIHLLVRHMPRAAIAVLAAPAALLVQIMGEVVHELEFLIQALVTVPSAWQQQGGDTYLVEIGLQVAPVAIGHLEAEAADHRLGLQSRVERHATLAGHFTVACIEEITIQLEGLVVHFKGGGTGVLQADHVGILGLQPTEQTSLGRSLNTIHVHTDDPHKWPPKTRACMIPELTSFS